jgi:hypothetical protein
MYQKLRVHEVHPRDSGVAKSRVNPYNLTIAEKSVFSRLTRPQEYAQ